MRRKKSILMAALVMAAASMMSFVSASEEEIIVIEGKLTNVPDSIVLSLTEWDGNVGDCVATDTVINGKFLFEIKTDIKEVHPTSINCDAFGFSTSDFLWIEPGAKVKITGDGLDYSAWKIKSNVAVQKTENRFRKDSEEAYSQLYQIETELYTMTEANDKGKRSDEEIQKVRARMNELNKLQRNVRSEIHNKENALLPDITPDEAWLTRLYQLSRAGSFTNDTLKLAQAKEQYARMDERLKATFHGQGITTYLFPFKVVKVGDMIPNLELKDTSGNTHRLQELKGKYILLDFWSSGCAPCIASFPELKTLSEQMKEKIAVVSVSEDGEEMWRKTSAKHSITWNNWNDLKHNNGIFAHFGIRTIPHYFLISPEGKIIATDIGYSKGSLFKFVKKTIAEHNKQE
ncbi:MAG: AhpC/TSA family protein [Bacteroidaceae bacterium]|nr:AhpC/TSA family protein [Bacteroidaceae bacterium]